MKSNFQNSHLSHTFRYSTECVIYSIYKSMIALAKKPRKFTDQALIEIMRNEINMRRYHVQQYETSGEIMFCLPVVCLGYTSLTQSSLSSSPTAVLPSFITDQVVPFLFFIAFCTPIHSEITIFSVFTCSREKSLNQKIAGYRKCFLEYSPRFGNSIHGWPENMHYTGYVLFWRLILFSFPIHLFCWSIADYILCTSWSSFFPFTLDFLTSDVHTVFWTTSASTSNRNFSCSFWLSKKLKSWRNGTFFLSFHILSVQKSVQ